MTAGGKYFWGWSPLSYCTSQLFCRVILPFAGLHARFDWNISHKSGISQDHLFAFYHTAKTRKNVKFCKSHSTTFILRVRGKWTICKIFFGTSRSFWNTSALNQTCQHALQAWRRLNLSKSPNLWFSRALLSEKFRHFETHKWEFENFTMEFILAEYINFFRLI